MGVPVGERLLAGLTRRPREGIAGYDGGDAAQKGPRHSRLAVGDRGLGVEGEDLEGGA